MHVSREEWLFRGLAIVMCLVMVGMVVMPAIIEGKCFSVAWAYFIDHERNPWKLGEAALRGALAPFAFACTRYAACYLAVRLGLRAATCSFGWPVVLGAMAFGA